MTRLEAFKQRMQQYKLARALNPLLKYWDFKALSYVKGGITDDDNVLSTIRSNASLMTSGLPSIHELIAALPAINKIYFGKDRLALYNLLTALSGSGDWISYVDFLARHPDGIDTPGDYTGTGYDDNERDLVRLLVFGNGGLEKYPGEDRITINGYTYLDPLYIGYIFPQKEIYFPKEAEPIIKDFVSNNRQVLQMGRNYGYFGMEDTPVDDVTEHGASFNYDDPENPIIKFFDNWNFGSKSIRKWSPTSQVAQRINQFIGLKLEELVRPNELYPDSGTFVLRLNVPIKYLDYDQWRNMKESDKSYKLESLESFGSVVRNMYKLPEDMRSILSRGWIDYENRLNEEKAKNHPLSFYAGGVTGEPEQNSFNYQGLIPIKPADNNPTNQLSDSDWSATDMVRLGSIAADIGAMFTPPGVSTGLSLASDLANLGADIADDRGFWNTAGTFAANLGLTTLGALPIVSQYAHASRAVKGLTKVAPKISAAVAGLGAAGLVSNADEILKSFSRIGSGSSLNKDDWRNIAVGVLLALGGGKAVKNANSSKRTLNPLSVNAQNAAVQQSLPEEVLRIIDEGSGTKQKIHIPENQLIRLASITPTNLPSPIQSNLATNPLFIQPLYALYKFPKRTLLEIKADYENYAREDKRLINYLSLTGTPNDIWKLMLRNSPSAINFKNNLSASLPYWQSQFVLQRAANARFTNGLNALVKNVNESKYNVAPMLSTRFTAGSIPRVQNPIFNDYGIEGGHAQFVVNPIYWWQLTPLERLSTTGHEMFHEMLNLVGGRTAYGDVAKMLGFYDLSDAYRSDPYEIEAHISDVLQHRWFKDGPFDLFPFESLDEMREYAKLNIRTSILPKIIEGLNDADKATIFNFIKKYAFGIIPALGISGAVSSLLSKDNDLPESYTYGTDEVGDENGQKQNKALNVVKNVLGFTPYLGDAISLYDAYKDIQNKDYLQAAIGAGLTLLPIPAAATKPIKKVAKKAAKEVARYIPTVNRKSVIELLNKLTGHDYAKMAKEGDINNMRNRSIERLYEPDVRARAELIKRLYDVDLLKTYDDILDLYTNEYHTLPQANLDPDLERNVAAQMTLTDLAREAFENNNSYIPKRGDYVLNVDNRSALPPQDIIDHEMTHYNLYMHLNSPNWEDSDLSRITNQFENKLNDVNPLDPANTSYFRNWMEQNAYGISVYNALKEQGIKPTKGAVKKYINSLPDTDPVKKAAFLFKTIDDYYNWLMAMPLADNNKETENTYLA